MKASSSLLGEPPAQTAQLLFACGNDLAYARECIPLLRSVDNKSWGAWDVLVDVLSPGYSCETTLCLLDRDVSPGTFSGLAAVRVPEERVFEVFDAGIEASALEKAGKRGFTFDELLLFAQNLREFEAAGGQRLRLSEAIDVGLRPDDLAGLGAKRILADQRALRERIVSAQDGTEKEAEEFLAEYLRAGILHGRVAWFDCGIGPIAAGIFNAHGASPESAAMWLSYGFSSEDAVVANAEGATPEDAARGRACDSWSAYFSRSSLGPEAFAVRRHQDLTRLSEVLHSLAVPRHMWVRMFSPRIVTWGILDGGVMRRDGYGVAPGRQSGVWVIGYATFRFLCGRMNLRPPLRLRGESVAPSSSELEAMFQESRLMHWSSLSRQAQELMSL